MSTTPNTPSDPATPAISELESQVAARREHLVTTIDELVTRVSPKEILRREVDSWRIRVAEATHTPDGEIRYELVAASLGALSVVLVTAGLVRRRRHR